MKRYYVFDMPIDLIALLLLFSAGLAVIVYAAFRPDRFRRKK